MIFSNKGKAFLISLEGICLSPYLDSVGVKTLGVGSTISDVPNIDKMPWDTKITIEQAIKLMDNGLKKYINAVNTVLDVTVTQHQFDALVSLCYNIGTGRVKARQGGIAGSTAIKRINSGDSLERIGQAMMMWNKPKEIIGRRSKEVDLFIRGDYGSGKALLFPVSSTTHKPIYSKGTTINVFDYI